MIDFIFSIVWSVTEFLFLVLATIILLPLKISQELSAGGIKAYYIKSKEAHTGYNIVLFLLQIVWIIGLMWWCFILSIKILS